MWTFLVSYGQEAYVWKMKKRPTLPPRASICNSQQFSTIPMALFHTFLFSIHSNSTITDRLTQFCLHLTKYNSCSSGIRTANRSCCFLNVLKDCTLIINSISGTSPLAAPFSWSDMLLLDVRSFISVFGRFFNVVYKSTRRHFWWANTSQIQRDRTTTFRFFTFFSLLSHRTNTACIWIQKRLGLIGYFTIPEWAHWRTERYDVSR